MGIVRTASIAAFAVSSFQSIARPEVVTVTSVIDGNTIVVGGYGRVRLAGIKAPRVGRGLAPDARFGREAKERLEGMVIRRYVRLAFEAGGSRAYVSLEDGTCVNAVLVREGLASVSSRAGGAPRTACSSEDLTRAEDQARSMRRGIWSPQPPTSNR